MENTPLTANPTPPQMIPTNPKMAIDHAQIIGELMADIQATNKEKMGGQGTKEPTQGEAAHLLSIFTLEFLNFFVVFYLK